MALFIERSSQFKRDYKRLKRQGADIGKLLTVVQLLAAEEPLPQHYRDHASQGNWRGYRDCHIEPDWLLIYKVESDTLRLGRTGSHSELFG
ncbi:MAG: type II toxin-antitoxin system YafQ family toxin [Caldilineaceae bacterium]